MTKKAKAKKRPVKKVKVANKRPGTVAKDVNQLLDLKRKLDLENAKLKPLKDKYTKLEEDVLHRYTAEELSSVKTKKGLVARTETTVPDLTDFLAFWEYAKAQNAPELFRKQVNNEAWREHVEKGQAVPGVEGFTKVGLSVRLRGGK